jgi:beta-fructofuranosidase
MNDPNGPVFFDGEYHLFYQHNPYGNEWGNMSWGHAVSSDLVRWRHLPMALVSTPESYDQHGVFSGCCVIHNGIPHILYTAVDDSAVNKQTQALAISRDRLRTWVKDPAPVIVEPPGGPAPDFRDPFCWKEGDVWHMALCFANGAGTGRVLHYHSQDLRHWEYAGVLCDQFPNTPECPNFFPLDERGSKWLLTVSPYGDVIYALGDYRDGRFHPESWLPLDLGGTAHFYAPNTLLDPNGRKVMWGWIKGGGSGQSPWNGCFTLPRLLELTDDGKLSVQPLPELFALRTRKRHYTKVRFPNAPMIPFEDMKALSVELEATLDVAQGSRCGLNIAGAGKDGAPLIIAYDDAAGRLSCGEIGGAFRPPAKERLRLRVFIDRSVVEIYANDRAALTARCRVPAQPRLEFSVWSDRDSDLRADVTVWEMADALE